MRVPPGTIRSPNIWENPAAYEAENVAVDPDGVLDAAIAELVGTPTGWGHVLDVGCGAGYHLQRLCGLADQVTGVEPHPGLVEHASRRMAAAANVTVRQGVAQALPVPDSSVDVAHARWAYFFGPGCEPGLAELSRVVRRGGLAVLLDHDATRSRIGHWFAEGLRAEGIRHDPAEVERFWGRNGFTRRRLDIRWHFASRAELARVLQIEFPAAVARRAVAAVAAATTPDALAAGTAWDVDAAVNLWFRRY